MPTLHVRFRVNTTDMDMENAPYGPIFHRWLPDGINDAVTISTDSPKTEIKVWFQRWGHVENGEIVLDYNHQDVDVELMKMQGVLVAGSLYGQITLHDIPDDVIDLLQNRRIGDEKLISLGKGVVKLVVPKVDRFLTVLRCTYGQFWIPSLESWDSRTGVSLGAYCLRHEMKWSIDGTTWEEFEPDPYSLKYFTSSDNKRDYLEYLTEEKWAEIKSLCKTDYDPTNGAALFRQAQRLLFEGHMKYAFIEGVTALEAVVSEFFKDRLKTNDELWNHVNNMDKELGIRKMLILVGACNKSIAVADIMAAQEAVSLRNKIIHEGKVPAPPQVAELLALFRVIRVLLTGPQHSCPQIPVQQAIKTSEEWQTEYKSP